MGHCPSEKVAFMVAEELRGDIRRPTQRGAFRNERVIGPSVQVAKQIKMPLCLPLLRRRSISELLERRGGIGRARCFRAVREHLSNG